MEHRRRRSARAPREPKTEKESGSSRIAPCRPARPYMYVLHTCTPRLFLFCQAAACFAWNAFMNAASFSTPSVGIAL